MADVSSKGFDLHTAQLRRLGHVAIAILAMTVASADVRAQTFTVPGKFDVSPSGAATYSIPIAVPPGTAGMAPSLSLDYNSQAGDGILGIGWSVGGLPFISRCPRTMAQDGVRGGVDYDANDRFCLEGSRLLAISGTYGADGAEYRTEVESFSRIISHGTAGTGPAWFEVRTKAGQIMEFGHSTDSQILATGKTTARTWGVNKVSDTKGNYFTVTYTQDTANGQAYPARIDYTGNTAAGVAPSNSVQFVYATRPDVTPLYHAGSIIRISQRLVDVNIYTGSTLVSDYRLGYQQTSTHGNSQLATVAKCTGVGSCLPATNIAWTTGGDGTFTPSWTFPNCCNFGSPPSANFDMIGGDFNGDGKSDFALIGATSVYTYLSNGDGTFTPHSQFPNCCNFGSPPHNNFLITSGDFNGDGKTDFALIGPTIVYTYLSNGDGTFTPSWQSQNCCNFGSPPSANFDLVGGDFNGDGKSDFALIGATSVYTYLSNGDGTFTPSWQSPNCCNFGSPPHNNFLITSGDFNGDGKADFALIGPTIVYTYLSNGDGTFTPSSQSQNCCNFGSPPSANFDLVGGDFNGDGNSDFALVGATSVYTYLSNGDGTFTPSWQSPNCCNFGSPPHNNFLIASGDFNGDGKADFALIGPTIVYTYLSNGEGTFTPSWQSPNCCNFGSPPSAKFNAVGGDFNGDGKSDFVLVGAASVYSYLANGQVSNLVSSITTGLGATTSLTHAPLTSASVYTKDTGTNAASYPIQDVQGPLYVVSRVDASNGIGGNYSSTYSYAGLKSDLSGRGSLGFRQMTVTDSQSGLIQTTTYRQDFPFIGQVASRSKVLGSQTLNQTTNSYGSTNLGGTRSVLFLSQNVENSWDLDGTAIPAVTTTYQYDTFGNATQITVSTPDGASKTTTNTYTNDTTNWYLGRLTRASVTSTVP